MAEKKLNTRIQLKYGAITEWTSTFTPKKGEVCFAEVTKDNNGNLLQVPAVVFKVGDGTKTFGQLPWASACAADVYDWAKKEHLELTDLPDEVVSATELETALANYYTKAEVEGLIADALQEAKDYVDEEDIFVTEILTVNATGGIAAGTDLNGLTTHEVLKKLLYPYVEPTVDTPATTTKNGTFEKGNDQKITSVSVKITKKSEAITSVALYNDSNLIAEKTGDDVAGISGSGTTITFSGLDIAVPSSNVVLTVKVTDTSGKTVSKNTGNWTFVYPYYYGVCADGATIDEALVEGLTKKVESKGTKTDWKFTLNNQCIVFAYPKAHGVLKSIIDPNNFEIIGSFTKHEVDVTGLDGTTQAYYVYVGGAASATDFAVDFKY